MIKKALIWSVIFCVSYSILLQYIPKKIAQHQWQTNIIKIEDYLYSSSNATIPNIVIGSSLAHRMKLPSNQFYSLALGGQGAIDGLSIVVKHKHFPKRIFIEMNMLLLAEDTSFTQSFFNPLSYYPKAYLPILQQGKQPLALMGKPITVIWQMIDKAKHSFKSKTPTFSTATEKDKSEGNIVFTQLLATQQQQFRILPEKVVIQSHFKLVANYIKILKNAGVEVIFFEMPIHSSLCNLPLAQTIRNNTEKYFPKDNFKYITQPDCTSYTTTDGIHLGKDEAEMYSNYFLNATLK